MKYPNQWAQQVRLRPHQHWRPDHRPTAWHAQAGWSGEGVRG